MDFSDKKINSLQHLIFTLADRPNMSAGELKKYFDGNAEQIQKSFNDLIDSLNDFNSEIKTDINKKADAENTVAELEKKADKTYVANELLKKVDQVGGMGLSSNDYTTEEKQKLESLYNYDDKGLKNEIKELEEEFFKKIVDTVNFKGNIKENELPMENNRKGDLYKFIPILKNKAYTSTKVIKNEIGYYTINGIANLLTTKEFEEYNQAYLSNTTTNFNLSVDFFTTDWKYITTVSNIEYSEGPLSYNVENSWNSIPDKLESNVDYYIVRTDSQSPDTTLPIKEVSYKPSADYAIYNGENFDKFYNDETVDNKIAEVEEDITKATDLKLIKKITLEEDVIDVKFTFDKPLSEIVFYFAGTFDETANNRILSITSDNRSWYMCNRGINISTSPIYYYAHAKETKERFWESHVLSTTTTSLLNGYSNDVLFISERPEVLSRYVKDLSITIASVTHYIKAGSIIEIWGREVE